MLQLNDFDIIKNNKYIGTKYYEFYCNHGYIPVVFTPYSHTDATNIGSTLCTECGAPGHASNMLVIIKQTE